MQCTPPPFTFMQCSPPPLTFMHIIAKMSRDFCPSDNMPILAVCRRPVMPNLQQQQQQQQQQSGKGDLNWILSMEGSCSRVCKGAAVRTIDTARQDGTMQAGVRHAIPSALFVWPQLPCVPQSPHVFLVL
jgi:hypothetical protein